MTELLRDFRFAARSLWQSRGFAATAVLTLALGIGPASALLSVENAMHFLDLPFREPDRIAAVRETFSGRIAAVSYPNYRDFRDGCRSFEGMAASRTAGFTITGRGAPFVALGGVVTPDFFSVLGVRPLLGRDFRPDEAGAKVLIVDHRFWRARLGGDPGVIGSTVICNREPHVIVGVLPPGFFFFSNLLWAPGPSAAQAGGRADRGWGVVARLRPGVALEGARAEVVAVAAGLARDYPATNAGYGGALGLFRSEHTSYGPGTLVPLLAAVGFLLLIACVNVASLVVARGVARAPEVALRAVLGAGRARIIRALVAESALIGVAGVAAGLLVAASLLPGLIQLVPENMARAAFPRGVESIRLDRNVLLMTGGLAVLAMLIFGLWPALGASRADLDAALRKSSTRATSRSGLHEALAIVEIALGLVLLTGTGLMIETHTRLRYADRGIDWDRVVRLGIPAPANEARRPEFAADLLRRVEGVPGVECAATSDFRLNRRYSIDRVDSDLRIDSWVVSPLYFRAAAIPLLRGRAFAPSDGPAAAPVAIVNQTLARRYFPEHDAIGGRLQPLDEPGAPWLTIVGVVGDARFMRNPTRPFDLAPQPTVYRAQGQNPNSLGTLVVRSAPDPRSTVPGIEQAVRSLVPDAPLQPAAGTENFTAELQRPRLNAVVSGTFAALGLLLSAIGSTACSRRRPRVEPASWEFGWPWARFRARSFE